MIWNDESILAMTISPLHAAKRENNIWKKRVKIIPNCGVVKTNDNRSNIDENTWSYISTLYEKGKKTGIENAIGTKW